MGLNIGTTILGEEGSIVTPTNVVNLENRCTKASIRFQRQPKIEPRHWNGMKGVKFKFNLPGEDVRVKQMVL